MTTHPIETPSPYHIFPQFVILNSALASTLPVSVMLNLSLASVLHGSVMLNLALASRFSILL